MTNKTPLKKRILKQPATRIALTAIMAALIRFNNLTSVITREVDAASEPYYTGSKNAIFAFWHGRLMMMPIFCPPGRRMNVLISQSNDGALIAYTMHRFGFRTVRGSSSRGAAQAAMDLLGALESGENASITPDGPRGPFQVADKGAVQLAKLSGLPVVPVSYSISRHKRLKSWDRFMIALPFSRIAFVVDAPLFVARDADDAAIESARARLETRLAAITDRADAMLAEGAC